MDLPIPKPYYLSKTETRGSDEWLNTLFLEGHCLGYLLYSFNGVLSYFVLFEWQGGGNKYKTLFSSHGTYPSCNPEGS